MHGQDSVINTVSEASDFLKKYSEGKSKLPLPRYEIIIKCNTVDRIEASVKDKKASINFLESNI
jgi:hypothetical protein